MRRECDCDNFKSSIASMHIIDGIPKGELEIDELLYDKELIKLNNEGRIKLYCENKNELIFVNSKSPHFRHNNPSNEHYYMGPWHTEWQSNFDAEHNEIIIGNRRCDVAINNKALEFQHSNISKEEIELRTKNHIDNGYEVYWIIDYNNELDELIGNETITLHLKGADWKYTHFINVDTLIHIYLNKGNDIFIINPNFIKNQHITISFMQKISKENFIMQIKENVKTVIDDLKQCTLYHNQRGAGCGKTFESIQLIQNQEEFKHKETFIYLTKLHSAKHVIYKEFEEQYKNKRLESLSELKQTSIESSKQIIFTFESLNRKKGKVIIGTIDSFVFANAKNAKLDSSSKSYFESLMHVIIENDYKETTKTGILNYTKDNTKLNKRTLIIVDEAQDLPIMYLQTLMKLMAHHYIDVYIIGDKLQSIWNDNNIHMYISSDEYLLDGYISKLLKYINVVKSDQINNVRRFHNQHFKDLVNNIIEFKENGLTPIEEICTEEKCRYMHNNIIPYKFIDCGNIYGKYPNKLEDDHNLCVLILKYMDERVEENKYVPENFMFIFPYISNNGFAETLNIELENYWKQKFNNVEYQNNVLQHNDYWRNKITDEYYHNFAFIHKSQEGESICLDDSEHSTRLLSIHSSKGTGRECVFVIGLSSSILKVFTNGKQDLQYESLLHVALTRQKKYLYVLYEKTNDDLSTRFKPYEEKEQPYIRNSIVSNRPTKLEKLSSYILNNNDEYKKINEIIEQHYPTNEKSDRKKTLLKSSIEKKDSIEYGHHLIKYCATKYLLAVNITQGSNLTDKNQFKAIMRAIGKYRFELMLCKDYKKQIQDNLDITEKNKSNKKNNLRHEDQPIEVIPILQFDNSLLSKTTKYGNIIKKIMENTRDKIKRDLIPKLCPLEMVILLHIFKHNSSQLFDDGDASIIDVYNIVNEFNNCYDMFDDIHTDEYKCLCQTSFNTIDMHRNQPNLNVSKSITNHYMQIHLINLIYTNYESKIRNEYIGEQFRYNISHKIKAIDENFSLQATHEIIGYSDKYVIDLIIAVDLNELNLNRYLIESIFSKFITLNIKEDQKDNFTKFMGKRIITCIITLKDNTPIFIEWNINAHNEIIINCIKSYLNYIYLEENRKVLATFKHFMRNCEETEKFWKKGAPYISNYLFELKNSEERKKFKSRKYKGIKTEQFIENLNLELQIALSKFLPLPEAEHENSEITDSSEYASDE